MHQFSSVEKHFFDQQSIKDQTSHIPYIVLENFPQLGLITSLRFLEWASENPKGVVSLPTGKTPEYFIKWTHHLLQNWSNKKVKAIRDKNGLQIKEKPDLSRLKFVAKFSLSLVKSDEIEVLFLPLKQPLDSFS